MTNTTTEYWDINGTSLQTYATNITSLSGRAGVPVFRGDNVAVAYRRGAFWTPKTPDQRTVSLGMWVAGCNPDGSVPSNPGARLLFRKNYDALRRLFWRDESEQVTLTRRWTDPVSGVLKSASSLAEVISDMNVEMNGNAQGVVVVDLLLADPFYYGVEESVTIAAGDSEEIINIGDARSNKIIIEFDGPLSNPELKNVNATPENWVRVGSDIANGDKVVLNVDRMMAFRESDSANMVAAVSRSGARQWLGLNRGANTLELTAIGAGSVTVKWQPAYF